MKGRTDVRTENDVMGILPNFFPSMGYQYFLSYGASRARAFGARGAPLLLVLMLIVKYFLNDTIHLLFRGDFFVFQSSVFAEE